MKRLCMFLLLLALTGFIHAVKVAPMPDLTYPRTIVVDNDRIFIGETSTVYIYSSKDFSLIKKFGKVGEGPGEFIPNFQKYPLGISTSKDHLLVASRNRLSYFSKDGRYIKEIKIKDPRPKVFYALGDNIFGNSVRPGKEFNQITFSLYDQELKELKEFHNYPHRRGTSLQPTAIPPHMHTASKSHIFTTYRRQKQLEIHCFDATGKAVHVIKDDKYQNRGVKTEDDQSIRKAIVLRVGKEVYENRWKKILEIPPYFSAVREMHAEGSTIYVVTHHVKEGNTEILHFQADGKLLKKYHVPLKELSILELYPLTIKGGKVYQLVDNEDDESYVLRIHDLK